MTYLAQVRSELEESAALKRRTIEQCGATISEVATKLVDVMRNGKAIYFCGNGGSAADSQHLAAELAGRYLFDRPPLPAHALTVNSSTITAIGNDYGYEVIFSRQLRASATAGDAIIGISTSGNSGNVVEAFRTAKELGVLSIALVGSTGGRMAEVADYCIKVPSVSTPRIQETHIAIGHILCGIIENEMYGAQR